jgi:hypothetical protein
MSPKVLVIIYLCYFAVSGIDIIEGKFAEAAEAYRDVLRLVI